MPCIFLPWISKYRCSSSTGSWEKGIDFPWVRIREWQSGRFFFPSLEERKKNEMTNSVGLLNPNDSLWFSQTLTSWQHWAHQLSARQSFSLTAQECGVERLMHSQISPFSPILNAIKHSLWSLQCTHTSQQNYLLLSTWHCKAHHLQFPQVQPVTQLFSWLCAATVPEPAW